MVENDFDADDESEIDGECDAERLELSVAESLAETDEVEDGEAETDADVDSESEVETVSEMESVPVSDADLDSVGDLEEDGVPPVLVSVNVEEEETD